MDRGVYETMIHTSHATKVDKVDEIIKELEHMYGDSFELKTILHITSGYIIYYSLNTGEKS